MASEHRLVEKLANMTALRDTGLLECSLLKSLDELLHPQSLKLIMQDIAEKSLSKELTYDKGTFVTQSQGIVHSEQMQLAINQMSALKLTQHALSIDDEHWTMHFLHVTPLTKTYVVIKTTKQLVPNELMLISAMLHVYRNHVELLKDSQTDQLTGLANRKTFDECIGRVYELMQPRGESTHPDRRNDTANSFWIAMIDIDHFKLVNDRFGHLYGDEVLMLLAQNLKKVFREDDMIFRFGGEEFAVVIRSIDQPTAHLVFDRLRTTIEALEFPRVGHITISIGAAQLNPNTFAVTLLDYADKALYHSKHNGRNQVSFYEDLLKSGEVQQQEVETGAIDLF